MGLYPRKAAKRAVVGGICSNTGASCGAPALTNATLTDLGRLHDNATSVIVKRRLKPIVDPEFCNVLLMPAADPRCSGGTEFMIDAVFGDANIPIAKPIINNTRANET